MKILQGVNSKLNCDCVIILFLYQHQKYTIYIQHRKLQMVQDNFILARFIGYY